MKRSGNRYTTGGASATAESCTTCGACPCACPSQAAALTAAVDVLSAVREAAARARGAGELPAFLGELARISAEALLAPAEIPEPTEAAPPGRQDGDRLLTAEELGKRIGMSRWWVYANKDTLPIVRLPTGGYRFSERGLERWIQRRRA